MNKFFTLVCMVAMTIGAYAQQNVPDGLKTAIEHLRYECLNDADPAFECGGVMIEGQDIVLFGYADESEFEGYTVKEVFELSGRSEEDWRSEMRKGLFSDSKKFNIEDTDAMYKYKYNLVLRYIGKQSKQQVNIKLNYWELPHK